MDKLQIQEQLDKGLSTYALAKHFGKSQTTIRYWLRKYGLNTKSCKKSGHNLNGKKCVVCSKELSGYQ